MFKHRTEKVIIVQKLLKEFSKYDNLQMLADSSV